MEITPNISSEDELIHLRNEGQISEAEYQELRDAMQEAAKVDVEQSLPEMDKTKAKRKLGKTAFTLMLAGFILPALGYAFTMIISGVPAEPTPLRVQTYRKSTNSTNTGNLRQHEQHADEVMRQHEQHVQRVNELKRATQTKRTTLVATLAALFFLCVASEIVAFVLGVIAWPDVLAKATVVSLSAIVGLLIVFVLLFAA